MSSSPRPAFESADTVNRVAALLLRFPELHSVRSNPAEASLTLAFALRTRLDRAATRVLGERIGEYVRAFLDLRGEDPTRIAVTAERDTAFSFVHVSRDAATFSREELELIVGMFVDTFGTALVRDAAAAPSEDDDETRDEQVEVALDALRDPTSQQRLVGFREESRVVVYFVHAGRRGARARS
jgi:hypothetical protein